MKNYDKFVPSKQKKMKKIGLLFLGSILLFSCGKESKKEEVNTPEAKEVVATDNYAIVFDAKYEKNDEISVVYKKNGYWDYDNPTKVQVTGQPVIQNIRVSAPQGVSVENFQIDISSNKEQQYVTIKGIHVFNNEKEIINGGNNTFSKYFNTGESVGWDPKEERFIMKFDGKYPPRMVGNEEVEVLLVK